MLESLTPYLQRLYVTANASLKMHRQIDLRRGGEDLEFEAKGKSKPKGRKGNQPQNSHEKGVQRDI